MSLTLAKYQFLYRNKIYNREQAQIKIRQVSSYSLTPLLGIYACPKKKCLNSDIECMVRKQIKLVVSFWRKEDVEKNVFQRRSKWGVYS